MIYYGFFFLLKLHLIFYSYIMPINRYRFETGKNDIFPTPQYNVSIFATPYLLKCPSAIQTLNKTTKAIVILAYWSIHSSLALIAFSFNKI